MMQYMYSYKSLILARIIDIRYVLSLCNIDIMFCAVLSNKIIKEGLHNIATHSL